MCATRHPRRGNLLTKSALLLSLPSKVHPSTSSAPPPGYNFHRCQHLQLQPPRLSFCYRKMRNLSIYTRRSRCPKCIVLRPVSQGLQYTRQTEREGRRSFSTHCVHIGRKSTERRFVPQLTYRFNRFGVLESDPVRNKGLGQNIHNTTIHSTPR